MNNNFLINGNIVEDSKDIANAFNYFYINYTKNNLTDSIFIAPATNAEIFKIFINLKKSVPGGMA